MNARVALHCALLLAVALPPALAHHEADSRQRVDRAAKGWPIGAFALVDHRGEPLAREQLLSRWTFVVFGHTRCVEQCAPALDALSVLSKRIAPTRATRDTGVLFVSLDPERDTPRKLEQFLAPYGAQWRAATGTPEMLARFAEDLGAASKGPGGSLVLVGPDGAIHAEYLPPYDALQITADYLKSRK